MPKPVLILSMLTTFAINALAISINGKHIVYNGGKFQGVDSILLFSSIDQAELSYTGDSAFVWRDFNGNDLQSGTGAETLLPEDRQGYTLWENGKKKGSYWVIDYSKHFLKNVALRAEQDNALPCEQVHLILPQLDELTYLDTLLVEHSITHKAKLSFHDLTWSEEEKTWTDSIAERTIDVRESMYVDASTDSTSYCLTDIWAEQLGISESQPLCSNTIDPVKVAQHLTHITTIRESDNPNKLNEPGRPQEEDQITGSAPMEILFKSNPTPAVRFFDWKIYKGTQLIVERHDEEIRYTFRETGQYRVTSVVSNGTCKSDSTEVTISTNVSKLLVPNVFTPNGDGVNDEFRVGYISIVEFHIWVYNRWGHEVYHSTDPAKGWDGRIGGKPAAEGAYFYVVRARGADDQKFHLKGDINLIR